MDARRANDRIAEKAVQMRFVSRVPMICECSDRNCRTIVMIGVSDFYALRRDRNGDVTAAGHRAEESQLRSA